MSRLLSERFAQMSAERDRNVQSSTEGRGYQTQQGFVQEIVTKSPARTHPCTNERVQTVTTRKSVTTCDMEEVRPTAPRLHYTSSTEASRSTTPVAATVQEVPQVRLLSPSSAQSSRSSAAYVQPRHVEAPSLSKIISGTSINSPLLGRTSVYAPSEWVKTTQHIQQTSSVSSGPPPSSASKKNVRIGGVDTKFIEPSRVSPLHVENVYAPVKFISRKDLRRLQEEQGAQVGHDFSQTLRHSSVPRLDSMLRDQYIHCGREFAPNGLQVHATRDESPPPDWSSPQVVPDRSYPNRTSRNQVGDEQKFFGQRPIEEEVLGPIPVMLQRRSSSRERQDDGESIASSAGAEFRRQQVRSAPQEEFRSPDPRLPPSLVTHRQDLPQSGTHVMDVAEYLSRARGTMPLSMPPQCDIAFQLLHRGTYLVKYGRQGTPHERFFSIRFVRDEETLRMHPYLLWAVHADAACFKDKLHLSHLVEVRAGLVSANVKRHLVAQDYLRGPYCGHKQTVLPSTYVLSMFFQSTTSARSVDVLALDEQTFRCWKMVADFFAQINTAQGVRPPLDAESLAPDTPRSVSSAPRANSEH